MPAIVSCSSPFKLSTRLYRVVMDPLFVWFLHYHLGMSEVPDNFVALAELEGAITLPGWFRTRHVRKLQEAGFRIDYRMHA